MFEVFARRLPEGRRYGVVAGTGRLLEAVRALPLRRRTSSPRCASADVVDEQTLDFLAGYRFSGDISGYAEGECYFPGSPLLVVEASFAEGVLLETLILSILNHDARRGRGRLAHGRRRRRPALPGDGLAPHPRAGGGRRRPRGVRRRVRRHQQPRGGAQRTACPTAGTSAHAFTLLHDDERTAFEAQVACLGKGTTLLVDTYDVPAAVRTAVEVAGPELGAVRLDSGDLLDPGRARSGPSWTRSAPPTPGSW